MKTSPGEDKQVMKKQIAASLLTLLAFAAFSPGVRAEELLLGGQTVGIEIDSEGVIVSGFCAVETAEGSVSPAEDAGFALGDIIVRLDGSPVRDAEDFIGAVTKLGGREAEVGVVRAGRELELRVRPALSETRQWLMGMWLRDAVSGIGTVTFIEPESGVFGALGHSVNEENTGHPVPLRQGSICPAEIVSVSPGAPGSPGELCGSSDESAPIGSVARNTSVGIFGHLTVPAEGRRIQTGELRPGEASILATLSGHEARAYSAQIDRVYSDDGVTHALLTVTDGELTADAGGIVQGMSGSPIIQDGALVGAVTHVFVNDPRRGFAVGIYDMLSAAGVTEQAA